MTEPKTIDVEAVKEPAQTQAVTLRQDAGAVSTQRMTMEELKANLSYIREVMQNVMSEGQDYGKIPGCGEKPALLQPGAQKLCMTFQLQDRVRKEEVRDLPGFHREYAFTICLVAANGKEWDGVGTCSTMESKYRYRKAERRCPKCGHNTIIQGKAEYGGGWLCWKKKGGCDTKFQENDPAITSQPGGSVEYENPPDYWNTARKMAFKRALVHAAINATNTSELWTQDVEEMVENTPPRSQPARQQPAATRPTEHAPQAPKPAQAPAKAHQPPPAGGIGQPQPATTTYKLPTASTREWMIHAVLAGPDQANRQTVTEYFRKLGQLMDNEEIEQLPLRFVPWSKPELTQLHNCIGNFVDGGEAVAAFEQHTEADAPAPKQTPAPAPAQAPAQAPKPAATSNGKAKDPEWWREIIVPIPRKGQKRADYMVNPDTIGSLYELRHGSDDEAQAARQRLWGFVTNYEPKGWTKRDGTEMPPSDTDYKFREALDAFADWFEQNHPGEKL